MIKRITLLLSFFVVGSSTWAAPYLNLLDTALAPTTNIYLSATGEATIAIKPIQYNVLTDSVYISKTSFTCSNINQNISVLVQIYDKLTTPKTLKLNKSTIISPKDTSAPNVLIKSAHTVYLNNLGTALLTFAAIDLGSYDACGININGFKVLTQTNFFCSDIGTFSIVVSVPDFHGNLSTKTIQITVADALPPNLKLKTHTLFLNGTGSTATLTYANINNNSTDNCALGTATINGQSSLTFSCADTGYKKIVTILNDTHGNSKKDSINILVRDSKMPTYTKTPYTAYLAPNSVSVSRSNILSNVQGGCYPAKVTLLNDTVFTCLDVSANPKYIRFSVINGSQTIVDSVAVSVLDTISPTLTLKADTLILVNGTATLQLADILVANGDNCVLASATLNGASTLNFTCNDTGANTITVIQFDAQGNSTTNITSVFVADTISPTYTKTPFTASLISSTVAVSRAQLFSNVSAGCFPPTLIFTSDTVFNCADVTSNPHFVKFSFSSGTVNILDSVAVTVIDTVKPNLQLLATNVVLVSNTATVNFVTFNNNSSDNCSLDTATINGFSSLTFTCADTGFHKLFVVLYDVNGNSKSDTVSVYVTDTVKPTYVKTPYTVYLQGNTATVNRVNLVNSIVGSCFPASLSLLSDTTFTCSALATNPNYIIFSVQSGTFTFVDSVAVTVLDTTKPSLILKADTLILQGGSANLSFANINNNSSDNCALDSALLNGASTLSFTCADTGSHKIVVILYDESGNWAKDSVNVFVADTAGPSYTKTLYAANLVGDSAVVRRANILQNVVGSCFTTQLTLTSDTVFYCPDILQNPRYVTFTITSGSFVVQDSVAIMVVDTTAPNLVLKSDTLYLAGAGTTANLTFANINNLSTDNCGLDSALVNDATSISFACADTGFQKVVVKLVDIHGNSSKDSVLVYIADTLLPSYVKTPLTSYLNGNSLTVSRVQVLSNIAGGCYPPMVSLTSDTTFTCASTINNPNYITFTVVNGFRTVLDSVAITVLDTTAPQLQLKTDTVILNGGLASVSFANVNNISTDNCSLDSATVNGLTTALFSCADTGWQKVVVVLYDLSSNWSKDSVNVFVADTISPTYSKTIFTASLIGDSVVVNRSNYLNIISGGCYPPTVAITSDTIFYCADVRVAPYYINFSITNGIHTIVDSAAIFVIDTVKPTVLLTPDTLILVNNTAVLNFATINNNSVDNCGLDSATINGFTQINYTCADSGLQKVHVVLYDIHGNSSADSVTVYVLDTISPNYTKVPFMAGLVGDSVLVSRANILANVSAGCYPPSISLLSDTVFYCSDIANGPHYIQFSIHAGLETIFDSVSISVVDVGAPTLVLKSDTLILQNGSAIMSFSNVDAGSFDNCGLDSALVNGLANQSFSCTTAGANKVIVTLYDVAGNVSIDSVVVYIQDSVPPTYTVTPYNAYLVSNTVTVSRANIISALNGGCSTPFLTILSDTVFTCTDVLVNPHYIKFRISNGGVPIIDSSAVTVLETIPPQFNMKPPPVLQLAANGTRVLTYVDLMTAYPTDNCIVDSIYIVPPVLSCANTSGYTPVIVTVFDQSGNYNTQSTFVLVLDVTAPLLVAKSDTFYLDPTGSVLLAPLDVLASAYDACGITSISLSKSSFNCSNIGLNTATVTASDAKGNSSLKAVSFYILDTLAPQFSTFSSKSIYLNNAGIVNITAADILLNPAVDNCSIASTVLSQNTFSCADIGQAFVSLTLTDPTGNSKTENTFVSIYDTIKPQVVIKNITVPIDTILGNASISTWDVVLNAFDNCGIDSANSYVSPSAFNCNNLGQNSVTIVVVDNNGNQFVSTATVTVVPAQIEIKNIIGLTQVCGNNYNVKYAIENYSPQSNYTWQLNSKKGKIVSTSFKGREIFVEWYAVNDTCKLSWSELNLANCGSIVSDTIITISGSAPDTSQIVFWNSTLQSTLVIRDSTSSYFQWGYDEYIGGDLVSNTLTGEKGNSYYNINLGANISNLGYKYWCEASLDGQCWNRSYFGNYPINIQESTIDKANVWPNPFTQEIKLSSQKLMVEIVITDLFGKTIYTKQLGEIQNLTLEELESLPASTYILQVKYKDGSMSNHKIVRAK